MNKLAAVAAAAAAAPAILTFATAVGCAPVVPPESTIDLAPLAVDNWRGLSLHGDKLHAVVEGRGILELDRSSGALVHERRVGERGLMDAAYRDLAVLDPGVGDEPQYILLADNEGYLYDPVAETEAVHFCVVPGEIIEGPITVQKNDAVAISGDTIVASPRFYEIDDGTGDERWVSSELRTYRLSDGLPLSTVGLTQQLELSGVAVSLDGVVGVAGDRLYRFGEAGDIVSEVALDDVDAAGLAVDNAANQLLVLDDKNDRILVLDASAL